MGNGTTKRKSTTTDIALIAAFAALLAVASLVAIPLGGVVPITLQVFAVLLTGAVLGARRAFLATSAYVVLGLAGLPIFAGGQAGLVALLGPTGGYLVGFIIGATVCGFLVERLLGANASTNLLLVFLAGLFGGVLVIHVFGVLGLVVNADMSLRAAVTVDLAFWIGDIAKNLLMAFVATAVHRAFPGLLPGRRR